MSAARPDTWMPIYWGDYARDTGDLGATMHGAYLMLIKHYWCTGTPLADDDAALWRIATCDSIGHWRRLRPTIERFFHIEGGVWRHKRIDAELERAAGFIEKQTQNGRKGGRPRKPDETQTETQTKPNGKPKPNPKITTSQPPSPEDDDARENPSKPSEPLPAEPGDPSLALAREIVAAYGRAVQEVWDLPAAPMPRWGETTGDFAVAKAWVADGVTLALCLDVFGPVLTAKRDGKADREPPGGMVYLDRAVRRKLAEIVPQRVAVAPAVEAAAQRYIEAMQAWKAGGRVGPEPRREDFDDAWGLPDAPKRGKDAA